MKIAQKLIAIIFIALTASSCSLKRTSTTIIARMITDGMTAMESEQDLWIAKQSVVPLVKVLEVLKGADPDNPKFSGLMAQIYGNVAFGFFEPEYLKGKDKEVWLGRMKRYYNEGYKSGMFALKRRFGKRMDRSIADFETAVKKASKRDMRILFWTAFNLGNSINLNRGDITAIADLPKVSIMLDKILKLDRTFGYGSALAFKAAMMASRPKMLGGDPEGANALFEEAVDMYDGRYLMTKVMYAQWYAMPMGNKKFTKKLLKEVIDADAMVFPEQALANKLAQERAEILIKRM